MTLGEKIRHHRKQLGLTQTEFGEKLGVKTNAVSKWECGRVEDIPTSKIKAMASLFNVPTSYLIDEEAPIWRKSERFLPSNIIPMPNTYKVPLIGTIACGQPILAVEDADEIVEVPENVRADFALRCKGDSMIEARIYDGDIVYIRSQPEVENGQIAAVRIGDEATLKKVRVYPDMLILEPANQAYEPLVYRGEELNDIKILGKAVAFTSEIG